ncbi:MAG: hypothetical protein Kow00109_16830 [Acidobacteriota bacterium]
MAEVPENAWRGKLRRFFLLGLREGYEGAGVGGYLPALLPATARPLAETFPWYLPAGGGQAGPLLAELQGWLEAAGGGEVLPRLLPELATLLAAGEVPVEVKTAVEQGLLRLAEAADLSPAAARKFRDEADRLRERIPAGGWVLPFHVGSLGWLWWAAAREPVRQARRELAGELRSLALKLEELLDLAEALAPAGRSAEKLAGSLGEEGSRWLDPYRLERPLQRAKGGSRGIPEERRERLLRCLEAVRASLRWLEGLAAVTLVAAAEQTPIPEDLEWIVAPSGEVVEAAAERLQRAWNELVELERRRRRARLEVEDTYEPARHEAVLSRLDGDDLGAEVAGALGPVVAVVRREAFSGASLGAALAVLDRGLPLRFCVLETDRDLSDVRSRGVLDPARLVLAAPGCMTARSSLARPEELGGLLSAATSAAGPSLLQVYVPSGDLPAPAAWERAALAWCCRAAPGWSCDASAGESWAESFRLLENPEPEVPTPSVRWQNPGGETVEEACDLAHLLSLQADLRDEFWVIPPNVELDELVPVGDAREPAGEIPPLPYIWVKDGAGELRRAVVSRRVWEASRNCRRAWRLLQELAGINNPHVERAVAAVREELERRFSRERDEEVERARAEGAAAAVERLVGLLTNPAAALGRLDLEALRQPTAVAEVRETAASGAEVASPTEAGVAAPAESEAGAAAEVEPEPAEEPYIDSELCTSCNDCINLNPRMFKYNSERQAYIADPAAGTFAELVKAAENCPARCIHPGSPRPGDPTVTPELLERAKAFR